MRNGYNCCQSQNEQDRQLANYPHQPLQIIQSPQSMEEQLTIDLTKLEQSIINQYKRLSYGEQTKIYESERVFYSPLPNDLPIRMKDRYERCVILRGCSVFQAITYAVIEHLFNSDQYQSRRVINKIRTTVCDENFMYGSGYIKGLIIKNLKKVLQSSQSPDIPMANYLNENDSMAAFVQFWKEIIEEQSQGEIEAVGDQPEYEYFSLIGQYLGIGFDLCWQSKNGSKNMRINLELETTPECAIVINNKDKANQSSEILEQVSFSSEKPIEYIICVGKSVNYQKQPFKIDLIDIKMPTDNSQLKRLKLKAWEVKQQGHQLLLQFKQFANLVNNLE